jgi:site-specific DNA-methyltransferase (adenine-specific)
MTKYKLLEGDALIQLQFVKAESIDTVFTSPQPPESYDQMLRLEQIMLQLPRVLKETGSIWINLGDQHNSDGVLTLIPQRFVYDMVVEHNWKLRGEIIWDRNAKTFGYEDKRRFRRGHEFLYWFVKDVNKHYFLENAPHNYGDVITSTYQPARPGVFESGFPTDLIARTAIYTTPEGGRILDPFCGTATTGVVALNNGMEFLGIEANPMLIDKINDRLSNI